MPVIRTPSGHQSKPLAESTKGADSAHAKMGCFGFKPSIRSQAGPVRRIFLSTSMKDLFRTPLRFLWFLYQQGFFPTQNVKTLVYVRTFQNFSDAVLPRQWVAYYQNLLTGAQWCYQLT